MPRQPGCHGSHFLVYFQEPGSGAESSSVAARLWAAITSRLPSARKIRAPTISRSVRICDPPWRRLSQTFRCPATMRGFASRIVPQLWARVLGQLFGLQHVVLVELDGVEGIGVRHTLLVRPEHELALHALQDGFGHDLGRTSLALW